MYCRKCGSPVGEGERFCTACGEKVESVEQPVQNVQQPYPQQPQGAQPPYGQQYGQPPYGQPPKKKSKAPLWIAIGLVAALAIAALIVFVVLPAGQGGLLSGNTTQTRFVNDSARVFTGAFEGLGSSDTLERMGKEPFEMEYELQAEVMGETQSATVTAAYDLKALGLTMDSTGSKTTILLLEEVLYQSADYGFGAYVSGTRFGSDADLSKDMTLNERVKALVEGVTQQNNDMPEIDVKKLAETFVNSIDESCFKKSADKWTLTLGPDDIINTLNNFIEKLEKDKELLADLEDIISASSPMPLDVIDVMKMAVSALEAQRNFDFELALEIEYKGNDPVGITISADVADTKVEVEFGYEKTSSGVDIEFEASVPGSSPITGELSYEKTSAGVAFDLVLTAEGQDMSISGSEEVKDGKAVGEVSVRVPGSDEMKFEYEGTIKFGKPSEKVVDDDRFMVDTENAEINEFSMFGIPGMSGFSSMPIDPGMSSMPTMTEPAESLEGTLWNCDGYQDGDMYVEGEAIYFDGGLVYFGQAGMSGAEIISSGIDVYGGVPYTFDGASIKLEASDGNTAEWNYDGYFIWAGDTMFYQAG